MSCNHAGDHRLAHALVDAAADAGADATKVQLYEPADLTVDSDLPHFRLSSGAWAGRRLWDIYTEARTPREWLPELFAHIRERGMEPHASVFAPWAVECLERIGCAAYKIASAEACMVGLVRCAAATGRPLAISDGAGIRAALVAEEQALAAGAREVTILRCVAEYPAPAESYRFADLAGRRRWGVSDHSCDIAVPVAAASAGATMVEAHLMLDAYPGGPPLDAGHSYRPAAFKQMAACVRYIASEAPEFARRWVYARDMAAGHSLTTTDVRLMRSGAGLGAHERVPYGRPLTRAVDLWAPVQAQDFGGD